VDILKVERHSEGGCVYGIRFFFAQQHPPRPSQSFRFKKNGLHSVIANETFKKSLLPVPG